MFAVGLDIRSRQDNYPGIELGIIPALEMKTVSNGSTKLVSKSTKFKNQPARVWNFGIIHSQFNILQELRFCNTNHS